MTEVFIMSTAKREPAAVSLLWDCSGKRLGAPRLDMPDRGAGLKPCTLWGTAARPGMRQAPEGRDCLVLDSGCGVSGPWLRLLVLFLSACVGTYSPLRRWL